jgi:hypothetical protein
MVTVSQLRDWRPEALVATADQLRRQAVELDALAQRLGDVTGTRLHTVWDGYAATEARTHVVQKHAQLAAFADQVAAGGAALSAAATAIAEAQALMGRAVSVATDANLRLEEGGIATAQPPGPAMVGLDPADVAGLRALQQDDIRQVTLLAQAALAAAEEADRDAARTISALPALTGLVTSVGLAISPLLTGGPLRAIMLAGLLQGITLRDLPPPGATAQQAAQWWAGLTPQQQQLQIRANPDAIGMLDGVPAGARHAANVIVLNRELDAASAEVARRQAELHRARAQAAANPPVHAGRNGVTSTQVQLTVLQRRLEAAIEHHDMLAAVQTQLRADSGRTLLLLDPAGEGRAAIALGPVDTAPHVAIVVPGLEQDVREDMGRIVSNAERLKLAADRLSLKVADGEEVATVAWIGYDTPNYLEVTAPGHAERGAVHLRGTVGGLAEARNAARMATDAGIRPEPVHLTVVGHSYGSLTTGIAARDPLPVDEVVFVGSPGVGVTGAGELQVPQGHVFVGENRGDPVADLQRFGTDPNDDRFGAREFQTDGGVDPLTGAILTEARGHSQHFDNGTESVRNLALITLGRDDLVTYGEMGSVGDGLVDALMGRGPR